MAQLRIPLDAQRFSKGLTWKDYMAQMGDTRARTEDNYAKSALTAEELRRRPPQLPADRARL
ncbi:MAG: hypothetical protein DME05_26625 [Candidatus Rokuibacteriota bacterium]|nr:MAG: hypothetical protein DME05_26625 [Candidatus Rokubacteria bacterium]